MKIFSFTFYSDTDWVLAPDEEEACKFYQSFIDCVDLTGCTVKEIPESQWSSMYILDINEFQPDEDDEDYNEDDYCSGYKIDGTFADYAKDNYSTSLIATTNF